MQRSQAEITMRCRPILSRPEIVRLVDSTSSPNAAYELAIQAGTDEDTAKAARWLGVLRRDYPHAYVELTKGILSHATEGTAQKGTRDETSLRSRPAFPSS